MSLACQPTFERLGAIAVTAGPRLGAVLVPAVSSRMSVLHVEQVEIFLPVRSLLRERGGAKTHLDPARRAVRGQSRLIHVVQILISGNRTAPERAGAHRLEQRLFP